MEVILGFKYDRIDGWGGGVKEWGLYLGSRLYS